MTAIFVAKALIEMHDFCCSCYHATDPEVPLET